MSRNLRLRYQLDLEGGRHGVRDAMRRQGRAKRAPFIPSHSRRTGPDLEPMAKDADLGPIRVGATGQWRVSLLGA